MIVKIWWWIKELSFNYIWYLSSVFRDKILWYQEDFMRQTLTWPSTSKYFCREALDKWETQAFNRIISTHHSASCQADWGPYIQPLAIRDRVSTHHCYNQGLHISWRQWDVCGNIWDISGETITPVPPQREEVEREISFYVYSFSSIEYVLFLSLITNPRSQLIFVCL